MPEEQVSKLLMEILEIRDEAKKYMESYKELMEDCDNMILEEKFVEYLHDLNKRFHVIEYAWNKLNDIYLTIDIYLLKLLYSSIAEGQVEASA